MEFPITTGTPVQSLDSTSLNSLPQKRLKEVLNYQKTALETVPVDRFRTITNALDPFRDLRRDVKIKYGAKNPSNAFLKGYEIFNRYEIYNGYEKLVTFHAAEFPGSILLATAHDLGANHPNVEWDWYASSFIGNATNDDYLDDTYHLYKNYPGNWLMDPERNGDLTSVEYIEYLQATIGESVDVYTSDLGLDSSSNPNEQEMIQAQGNFGQILAGLVVLKKGGTLLTKQYTMFEPFTVSLMIVVSGLFDNFRIIKPSTSRSANSETYVLATGYRGISDCLLEELFERLECWDGKGLLSQETLERYPEQMEQLFNCSQVLAEIQGNRLETITRMHKKHKMATEQKQLFGRVKYDKTVKEIPTDFYGTVKFSRIKDSKFELECKDTLFKRKI